MDSLLTNEDPYRNDKEVYGVYYPYLSPYNQAKIEEQNDIVDMYDPQAVPNFDLNFRNKIDWKTAGPNTIYHQPNKNFTQEYSVKNQLLDALGPYVDLG
jgi:hypothetical protein